MSYQIGWMHYLKPGVVVFVVCYRICRMCYVKEGVIMCMCVCVLSYWSKSLPYIGVVMCVSDWSYKLPYIGLKYMCYRVDRMHNRYQA